MSRGNGNVNSTAGTRTASGGSGAECIRQMICPRRAPRACPRKGGNWPQWRVGGRANDTYVHLIRYSNAHYT